MTGRERRFLAIACVGHILCHASVLVFAAVLQIVRSEFGMTLTAISAIGTISYLLYGLGSLPSGLIVRRIGIRTGLLLFFGGVVLTSLLLGFSRGPLAFGVWLALLGAVASLYHVSGLTLLARGIDKTGRALGLHGIAGGVGIGLTPLVAAGLAAAWGWRAAYLALLVPGAVGLLLTSIGGAFELSEPEAQNAASAKPVPRSAEPAFVRRLPLAFVVIALNGFTYRGFVTLFPTVVAERVVLPGLSSLLTGGLVATLILSIGTIGQYAGGAASDRFPMAKLYVSAFLMTVVPLVLLGVTRNVPFVAAAVACTVVLFAIPPIENHLISRITPPQLLSTAYGIKLVVMMGIGSLGALFAGAVTERWGSGWVYPLLGAGMLVASVVAVVVIRTSGLEAVLSPATEPRH